MDTTRNQIREELERIYLKGAVRVPLPILVMLAAIASFAYSYISAGVLLAWIGTLSVLFIGRWILALRTLRSANEARFALTRRWMPVIVGLIGLIAGVFCIAAFRELPLERKALVTVVYVGWFAGAVGTNYSVPLWLRAFSVPMMLSLTISWLFFGGEFGLELAALLVLFTLILYLSAQDSHRVLLESINRRYENLALIADLEKRGRELQSALNAKSHFLAAASHDLRQPVASIALYASSIQSVKEVDDVHRIARKLQAPVDALESVLSSILELSRLEAGVIVPRVEPISVACLLQQLAEEYEVQAQRKGLGFKASTQACGLVSDPILLERLLRNLLANAVKFTQSGCIFMQFIVNAQVARIQVSDTGIGIPAEWLDRVFEEYTQIANPQRDRNRGLGLGLSIVQRIASLLGARVSVESRVGEGSRFCVDFPLSAVCDVPVTRARVAFVEAPSLKQDRVLIVEDDPFVSDALVQTFNGRIDSVVAVGSAEELDILLANDPALMFSCAVVDHRLPGPRCGFDVIELLEKRNPLIRSVLITGDFDKELLLRAERQQVTVLHKPISSERLLEALSN